MLHPKGHVNLHQICPCIFQIFCGKLPADLSCTSWSQKEEAMITMTRFVKHNFSMKRLRKKLIEIDELQLIQRSPRTTAILKELYDQGGFATTEQLRIAVFPEFNLCNIYTQQDLVVLFSSAMVKAKTRAKKLGIDIHYERKNKLWYAIVYPKKRLRIVKKRIIVSDTAIPKPKNPKKIN
jgi:hypothetical protein